MATLLHKLQITGTLTVETGLHIGGSEVELDIGGIDSEVIKIKQGDNRIPYIPGSSLKGKLRNLIARSKGFTTKNEDKDETKSLFEGDMAVFKNTQKNYEYDADKKKHPKDDFIKSSIPSRLIVRDAYMIEDNYEDFLEDKAENVITRETGRANPRHAERVTKGAKFEIDMILDVYKRKEDESRNEDKWDEDDQTKLLNTLRLGFNLLQQDYLGGSGTRGYGQVSLEMKPVKKIKFNEYGDIIDKEENKNVYEFDLDGRKAPNDNDDE